MRWLLAGVLAACGVEPRAEPAVVAKETSVPVPTCADTAATIVDPRDAAVARAACAEQRNHRVPSIAVAIAEHGEIVFRFAHGVRCNDRPGDVSPATAFRIGSLSKAITAATAYAIAERGEIDLDAPLGDAILRAVVQDTALAQVTLRQLLDHRAGLGDVLPNEALRDRAPPQQLATLVGPALDPPGTTWRYANGGYALVGAVLSHTAKLEWPDLVRREVLDPLGMTTARAIADPTGDVACGHLQQGERLSPFDVREDFDRFAFGVQATAPAGAIIATPDDMLRFALALSQTTADRPTWAKTMLDAVVKTAGPTGRRPGERYAAGLQVVTVGDEIVLRHAGNTGDFAAELVWAPDRGAAAVVLGNAGVPLAATVAAASTRIGIDPRRD